MPLAEPSRVALELSRHRPAVALRVVVGVAIAAVIGAAGISVLETMPPHAIVLVIPENHEYFGPDCVQHIPAWRERVISTTAQNARAVGYSANRECVNAGAFVGVDVSLLRLGLERIGFPAAQRRWDKNGRWEW